MNPENEASGQKGLDQHALSVPIEWRDFRSDRLAAAIRA
jgi:hypothetical protein